MRARFRATVDITDQDVAAALTEPRKRPRASSRRSSNTCCSRSSSSCRRAPAPAPRRSSAQRGERVPQRLPGLRSEPATGGGMPGIVVKPQVRREEGQLTPACKERSRRSMSAGSREPQRVPEGIQLLAVCAKNADRRADQGGRRGARGALHRARRAARAALSSRSAFRRGHRISVSGAAPPAARPDPRRAGGNRPRHRHRGLAGARHSASRPSSSPATRRCSRGAPRRSVACPARDRRRRRRPKLFAEALPCLEGAPPVAGHPGRIDAADTAAVIRSIRSAVELVRAGAASAVVTNPIQKKALNEAGFRLSRPHGVPGRARAGDLRHAGHAGDDARRAGPQGGAGDNPYSARGGAAALTTELIVETGRIVARDLQRASDRRAAPGGRRPQSACRRGGYAGREDAAIVRPAVETLRRRGSAIGPPPADTMFHAAARARPTTRRSACTTTRR